MKLKTKYVLFVVILHLVTLVLTYYIFEKDKLLFMASEVFVIISILISWKLYQQLLQPLKSLIRGIDAIRDKDFNVKFLPTGKYEVDQLIGVYNQMMDNLRTERTRQEQQHFFLEKLIHTSPAGIIILDFDNRVKQLNPAALKIIGVSEGELINHPVDELSHDIFKRIAELKTGETRVVKLQGAETHKIQKSHFIDRGFSLHFIMIQELTAEILAAEKNVYGKVIRMMAHEVNNTIGPVNSIIESAISTDKLWEPLTHNRLKDAMQVALQRNQNLNLFMRNFADLVKLPLPIKSSIDLHTCIQNIIDLFEIPAREKNIVLEFNAPVEPFYIMADQQLIEQSLINIVKNAIEAIHSKGEVVFKSDVKNRRLAIVDNGKGLSEQESEQLFTPFYSSKKDGQGIGLTLVKDILSNHGFNFSLKTVEEKRTEFSIVFT